MTAHDWLEVFILFAGTVLAIVGWLISTKVSRIDLDLDKLQDAIQMRKDKQIELELLIAKQHPTNDDIKAMFKDFMRYLDERFNHIEQLTKSRSGDAGSETGRYHNYSGERKD